MASNTVTLGRPWRPGSDPSVNASAAFINTWMDDHIGPDRWTFMNSADAAGVRTRNDPANARFFEGGNTGPGASNVPATGRSPGVREYTIENVLGDWRPNP